MATDAQLERNKAFVIAFYDLMFNDCDPATAMERFAGDVYIQHNPHVGDGKQAFIDYFERMAPSTRASASSSSEPWPRGTTWSCTATRSGQATTTTPGSTYSAWTTSGRSSNTGTSSRSFPRPRPTTTACSDKAEA